MLALSLAVVAVVGITTALRLALAAAWFFVAILFLAALVVAITAATSRGGTVAPVAFPSLPAPVAYTVNA